MTTATDQPNSETVKETRVDIITCLSWTDGGTISLCGKCATSLSKNKMYYEQTIDTTAWCLMKKER